MKKLLRSLILSTLGLGLANAAMPAPNSTYKTQDLESWFYTTRICERYLSKEQCQSNQDNLKKDLNFVSTQISSDNAQAIHQIKAYDLNYNTIGVNGDKRAVSGGIIVPETRKIKGIVLFYHSTEVTKHNVPSCFYNTNTLPSYCDIGGQVVGSNYVIELGSVFASQGYVVVMPDYIGQGLDSSVIHPFLAFPEVNARTGLDMLPATRDLLKNLGYTDTPLNLFISGYSEGGAYAMWASKLAQSSASDILSKNKFILKATAPISGVYDLADSQLPLELANVAVYPASDKFKAVSMNQLLPLKPLVMGYMLSSFAYYKLNESYSQVFQPSFADMTCGKDCLVNGKQYTIPELFSADNPGFTYLNMSSAIASAAAKSINPKNNKNYLAGNNSISAILAPNLLENPMFKKTMADASIYKWKTKTPVSLIYLEYDSVVTNLNSDKAYSTMSKLSGNKLVKKVPISNFKYVNFFPTSLTDGEVIPLDHLNGRIFLYIAALNEFNHVTPSEQ